MIEEITLQGQKEGILTNDALGFIMELVREFRSRHVALLADRKKRQDLWDNGELPNFLAETWEIQKVANACLEIATDLWPLAVNSYRKIRSKNGQ